MIRSILARLIAALWLGSGAFFIAVAAPAAFKGAMNPTAAANIVGTMLGRWHYLSLAAPLILLALYWRSLRTLLAAALFAGIVAAAAQALVDMRVRSIRMQSPVAISSLPKDNPVRRQFGMLHGVSALLLLVQVAAAGVVVAAHPPAAPPPPD